MQIMEDCTGLARISPAFDNAGQAIANGTKGFDRATIANSKAQFVGGLFGDTRAHHRRVEKWHERLMGGVHAAWWMTASTANDDIHYDPDEAVA